MHKKKYDGEIRKCPNCGELINAYDVKCESCGYEFRETKTTSSLEEFSKKLLSFDELILKRSDILEEDIINMKISYIGSYAIPNNKEDILEFMITASSNINTSDVSSKNFKSIDPLNQAWISKMEQAFEKANLAIKDTEEYKKIEKIYNDKKSQVALLNKKILARKMLKPIVLAVAALSMSIGCSVKNGTGFIVLAMVIFYIAIFSFGFTMADDKKKRNNKR